MKYVFEDNRDDYNNKVIEQKRLETDEKKKIKI